VPRTRSSHESVLQVLANFGIKGTLAAVEQNGRPNQRLGWDREDPIDEICGDARLAPIVVVVVARASTGNAAPVHPRSRDRHTPLGEEPHTIDRLEVSKVSL
jgi:hypothetical protein